MSAAEALAATNACLNLSSALLIAAGFVAIRRRQVLRHRRLMLAACCTSVAFLVGYVLRVRLTGLHHFPLGGGWRTFYLSLLTSHMLLAVAIVPLVLRALYLALRRRDAEHRRVARIAWPSWMYVSVTGVVVYLLLYQVAPRMLSASTSARMCRSSLSMSTGLTRCSMNPAVRPRSTSLGWPKPVSAKAGACDGSGS
jgi:putative membrane protein